MVSMLVRKLAKMSKDSILMTPSYAYRKGITFTSEEGKEFASILRMRRDTYDSYKAENRMMQREWTFYNLAPVED